MKDETLKIRSHGSVLLCREICTADKTLPPENEKLTSLSPASCQRRGRIFN